MFWQTSSVIPTWLLPRNSPFFQVSSRGFAGSSVVPISTSLPPVPMRSNTLGTVCWLMSCHRLLCSGRSCRECILRRGCHRFWWHRCCHRKSGSLIFCRCQSMNHSNFRRCETCWSRHTCGVPLRPKDPPASRVEVIQRLVRKADFSISGCAGCSCRPPAIHCGLVSIEVD